MSWRMLTSALTVLLGVSGCSHQKTANTAPQTTVYGAAIVEVGGSKQMAQSGMTLDQPVVVQVNDSQGNTVSGAAVQFHGPAGVVFNPASALTDSSGQVSTAVTLGGLAGRYQLAAVTNDKDGKVVQLKLDEIALGYQQALGQQLNRNYCERCHDPESTPLRVSNFDNLNTKPHPFNEGDTLNKISDADLVAIISYGGPALGKSPEMPPYGYTLTKDQIQALIAYIRAISEPPYRSAGVVYAQK